MFCFQCQEAARNEGCTVRGVCGKDEETANLQDLLVYTIKGLAYVCNKGYLDEEITDYIPKALFTTITNVNFDKNDIISYIKRGVELREKVIEKLNLNREELPKQATWTYESDEDIIKMANSDEVRILAEKNEDIRSLKELITYGIKGIGAYLTHAMRLGYNNEEIHKFIIRAFSRLIESEDVDELFNLALETGKYAVETLALLDKANTETYGHPEITEVSLEVRDRPGILISGHDLKDLEELLEQSKGQGVDIYTHSEMLPAHYYPFFKKYEHFAGNYGGSWWRQTEEFEKFNGPIVMTTNCLVPPKDSYKDRVYVTNEVGYPGLKRIPEKNGKKDFSEVIEHAKKCKPPTPLEKGKIVGGFAHNQVLALADKIIEAVKSGKIRKFVVMAGCDGRHKTREYYTEFAKKLPKDTVILTCGCAKYRFIKLDLGEIDGIPRVLDAGQCNDSYSLVKIALALKDAFGLEDINDLPIAYNIAWYEQKAVAVLLALLYLGVKNIVLGPTLPAFLSENVAKVLVEKFGISQITTVDEDIKRLVG
ncbi:hybrid cluster protein [Methanocaldococcus infernus ME]|uniref:Hydroxylamine reductase n=1 Tax=Methanocaldococcus infernus (strain DSM 11812 / JCM 15783 / ME) TaxID=573063 RepID=D5VRY8_METIM|nr:hydroxylamine reductase [Methanocaldococcus infernus]ADG13341.1 hybrid cluster protein [Methanocaldococcus infernus ME]